MSPLYRFRFSGQVNGAAPGRPRCHAIAGPPRVSKDKPYSGAHFKTVKYPPGPTPEQVDFGQTPEVIEHRQSVLAAAYAARPDRFAVGPPRAAEIPEDIWINRALTVTAVDGAESVNGGRRTH